MAKRGAPIGNQNAKGARRGAAFAVGLVTGGVGSGAHAINNSSKGLKVHSGMHSLGTGAGGALLLGGLAHAAGYRAEDVLSVAAQGGVRGLAVGYASSKIGNAIGTHIRNKRNKKNG